MIGSWISLRGREEFGLDRVEIAWDGDPGLLMDGGTNQSLDGAEGLGGLLCLLLLALAFTGAPSLDGYIPCPFPSPQMQKLHVLILISIQTLTNTYTFIR